MQQHVHPEKVLARVGSLKWDAGRDFHDELVESIYTDAARIADRAVTRKGERGRFDLDRTIDRLVTSRWLGFPLMLRSVRLGIESVDPRLENVARTLGAGRLRTFLTITLRLALPGLIVGSLLTFARSLGEFGATITFAANIAGQTRTIPSAIYTYLNQPGGEDRVIGLVIVSVALSLVALIASEWSARRLRAN